MDENAVSSTPSVETSAPDTSYEETYTEPTVEDSSSESSESSAENNDGGVVASVDTDDGGMSLVKDPVTGEVSLKIGESNDNDETSQENGQAEPDNSLNSLRGTNDVNVGQGNLRNLPMYNLEEFSSALANGYVDPNRVPQEYQAQYADYRIKQALQQRQAQQQAAYQREMMQRQQVAMQLSPENRAQVNADFYNALEEAAETAALRDLGITKEQLEDAEFEDDGEELIRNYNNAKDFQKQRIRGDLEAQYRQEQNYKYQQQTVYNDMQNFVAQQRASEPNFDAIDKMLPTRYQTLPHNQGVMVEAALVALRNGTINDAGRQLVEDYYNFCRQEFYASKNGLQANGRPQRSNRPPVVESAGQGQQVSKSYKPNYKALRKANSDSRDAWFKEYFKNNGW